MIIVQEHVEIHQNMFDDSTVQYFKPKQTNQKTQRSCFDIIFDQKLFQPKKATLDLEAKLTEEAEKAKKKS